MTTLDWSVAVRRFPTLTISTPRLVVRPLAAADAEAVTGVFSDKVTRRWLPVPRDYSSADAETWCTTLASARRDRGEGDHFGIIRRVDDRLVGCAWARRTDWGGCSTELSFAMSAEIRGYGVAPEAVDALCLALLLEHDFQRVELRVTPGNISGRRVAEKAGFTYEGLLRNAGYVNSGRVDQEVWSLVAADLR